MRKIAIIFLVLIASINSISQDVVGSRVIAKQSFFLRDRWIDSIRVDTVNIENDNSALMTAGAIYKFVAGRMSSGGAAVWGSITGTLSNQTDLNTALGLRLLKSDTSSMLANYIRDKGYGLLKSGQLLYLDSTTVFPQIRATIPSGSGAWSLTNGGTLLGNNTISQAGFDLTFNGGGKVQFDSIRLSSVVDFIAPDSMYFYGHSFPAGIDASVPDSAYPQRLAAYFTLPMENFALSGSGVYYSSGEVNSTLFPVNRALVSFDAMYNDLWRAGNNNKTYRKIVNGYKNAFAAANLKSFLRAGTTSDANYTIARFGSWTTVTVDLGGRGGTNGAYTNTLNDSITAVFTGNNVIVYAYGDYQTTTYGTFDAYIDNVLIGNYSLQEQSDGISDGTNNNQVMPIVFFFDGLSEGAHKIKLVNATSSRYLVLDGFGQLKDAEDCTPGFYWKASYSTAAGYASLSPGSSIAITNTANGKLDSLWATSPFINYDAAFLINPNNCFDTLTGVSADGIHPNDVGMRQYKDCAVDVSGGVLTNEGSIYYTASGYIGNVAGTRKTFLMDGDISGSDFIVNSLSQQTSANFNIDGIGTIGNFRAGATSYSPATAPIQASTSSGSPVFSFYLSSAGSNNKIWDFLQGSTTLSLRAVNDAVGAATNAMQITRSGTTISNIDFSATAMTTTGTLGGQNFNLGSNTVTPTSKAISLGLATSTDPYFSMYRSSSGTNEKVWDNYAASNTLNFRLVNDAVNAANNWMTVTRTAHTAATINFPLGIVWVSGVEGAASSLLLRADEGDDATDTWTAQSQVDNDYALINNSVEYLNITSAGAVTLSNLAGTGSRAVLADANGLLSAPVSDRSVKKNINSLDYGLGTIMKLNPVSFEYIDSWKNYGQGTQIGFIAQDIQKVLPNSTFTTPSTGKMGYNEIDLVPILVKAVQEQQEQIDTLKKEIIKLKKKK